MNISTKNNTGKLLLFNFLIVATLGVIMRYKIAFDFPYLDQKNLQHAHSHFAFTGWVSQSLLFILFYHFNNIENAKKNLLYKLLITNLCLAYGMLISFAATGYSVYSIILATLSLIVFFYIAIVANKVLNTSMEKAIALWFKAAFLFGILSSLGTLSLSVMMATKNFDQHLYLSSVYWYLHFQYNGYFLFMCLGLLNIYALQHKINIPSKVFWLLFISTFFTYGLSVLWLNLPLPIYIIVAIATVVQSIAIVTLVGALHQQKFLQQIQSSFIKFLFRFLVVAIVVKYALQLGSTIPAISQFAFGFRSIVIAYLHLVLLAIISVSIVCFLFLNNIIIENKSAKKAVTFLCIAIFLNELVLCLQGVGSVSYIVVPYANETLLGIALLLFAAISWVFVSQKYNSVLNNNLP